MIGYVHDTAKIWRLWDPVFWRIVCLSDVIFDESKIPRDPKHGPGSDIFKDSLPEADIVDLDEIDSVEIQAKELQHGTSKIPASPGAGQWITCSTVPPPNGILSKPS
jgi:hypothetical protein